MAGKALGIAAPPRLAAHHQAFNANSQALCEHALGIDDDAVLAAHGVRWQLQPQIRQTLFDKQGRHGKYVGQFLQITRTHVLEGVAQCGLRHEQAQREIIGFYGVALVKIQPEVFAHRNVLAHTRAQVVQSDMAQRMGHGIALQCRGQLAVQRDGGAVVRELCVGRQRIL